MTDRTPDNTEILRAFRREPDGAWTCITATAITTLEGNLTVEPGMTFTYGERHGGLDVAEYLEQLGVQFGS